MNKCGGVKVLISGGQSGSDLAALKAGKTLGIKTDGVMPKTFRTLDGPKPEYAELYGVKEHAEYSYVPRTGENVEKSDGTVRIAGNFNSNGEKCTLRFIHFFQKPYFDVDKNNPPPVEEMRKWLEENKIETLNVAGNAEQNCPGIEKFAYEYLLKVFEKIDS